MESEPVQDSLQVCVFPLSKPFYMNNANTNKAIFFIMGIIFLFLGIIILTASKAFVYGIIFIALGVGGIVCSVMLILNCTMQTGNCPYCKKKLAMKYREKQFSCPLCNRPVFKTKTTIENAEPLFLLNVTEPNISFEEMRDNFFNAWQLEFQCDSEQRKRLERARTDTVYRLFEINPDNGTAFCYSSNYENSGKVYEVTYKHCTCPDFQKRFCPCKHIYALNVNLGIISMDEDLSGIPKDIKEKMDMLPENVSKYFWNTLKKNPNKIFLMKKSSSSKPLFAVGFIKDTGKTILLLDMLFSRNDLVAKIYENNIDYKPSAKTTKDDIIAYLIKNEPDFIRKITKNDILAEFDDEVSRCRQNICDYYSESQQKDSHHT